METFALYTVYLIISVDKAKLKAVQKILIQQEYHIIESDGIRRFLLWFAL